ncbi:PIN domain-containing protein [Aquiflexum lacus]|uniref:PIN domain-containing protein n=1 Tax=Aquiflexum lacus TaxID=2483805 RepID=UPI0018957CDE|nr:PIN domain-containing protein [Aquiflexum lacus]
MISNAAVVDTNIILSALISKSSGIREKLFDETMNYFAPNYIIIELYKHKEKLLKYSKLDETEFFEFFSSIVNRINFVSLETIKEENKKKAYHLCKSIDIKDTPFVALSIQLKIPLWTGDKKLKQGLIKLGFMDFGEE